MTENQNTEYKEAWRDEYLKWICGFANAQGGRIYVGIRDDGSVIGVPDATRLMEDIPNKIKNSMGILADVNRLRRDDKDIIEIVVPPTAYPVSFRGEYHYRCGRNSEARFSRNFCSQRRGENGMRFPLISFASATWIRRVSEFSERKPAEAVEWLRRILR